MFMGRAVNFCVVKSSRILNSGLELCQQNFFFLGRNECRMASEIVDHLKMSLKVSDKFDGRLLPIWLSSGPQIL